MSNYEILAINPGSTSTKIALFKNEELVSTETLRHSAEEIAPYKRIVDQLNFRRETILKFLKEKGISTNSLSAIVGRGGLLGPLKSGTYQVTEEMLDILRQGNYGEHASNLGALIAYEIASSLNIPAYIVDPVTVNEMEPVAKISGMPEIERASIFHALNAKAVLRMAAKDLGAQPEKINFIIAHMGGGISVSAMKQGNVVDVNNALEEGPFSPERTGSLPTGSLVKLCYSGKYTLDEMKKKLVGQGGMAAYLGTTDGVTVEKMIAEGDKKAKLVFEAMAYQVAKEIGAMATVMKGDVKAIILTGGLAYSKLLTGLIKERVEFIAPVMIYPGEDEMKSLAMGAFRVLTGEEKSLAY